MHNYKKLKVWEKAIELATDVYSITASFPTQEKYNLVSQMKRSAISISSNIAEGAGRNSDKDFARFLSIAYASLYELESQIIVSAKLNFIKENVLESKIEELQKMIYTFIQKLN